MPPIPFFANSEKNVGKGVILKLSPRASLLCRSRVSDSPEIWIVRLQYSSVVTVPGVADRCARTEFAERLRTSTGRRLPIRGYRTMKQTPRREFGTTIRTPITLCDPRIRTRSGTRHRRRTSPGSICIPIYSIS